MVLWKRGERKKNTRHSITVIKDKSNLEVILNCGSMFRVHFFFLSFFVFVCLFFSFYFVSLTTSFHLKSIANNTSLEKKQNFIEKIARKLASISRKYFLISPWTMRRGEINIPSDVIILNWLLNFYFSDVAVFFFLFRVYCVILFIYLKLP